MPSSHSVQKCTEYLTLAHTCLNSATRKNCVLTRPIKVKGQNFMSNCPRT